MIEIEYHLLLEHYRCSVTARSANLAEVIKWITSLITVLNQESSKLLYVLF